MSIGVKLKAIEQANDMTTTALAAKLGVSASYLAHLYAGRAIATKKILRGILEHYPRLFEEAALDYVQAPSVSPGRKPKPTPEPDVTSTQP